MPVPGTTPSGSPGGNLREAAVAHLARFATTELGLFRVLERRIARWGRQALEFGSDPDDVRLILEQALADARAVVADMVRLGALSDAGFAEGRARALARGGRSRRAIAAHLASRGVASEAIEPAMQAARPGWLEDAAEGELAAALVQARRRRLGAFARQVLSTEGTETAAASRQRALAALARAGFSHDVALQALETDLDTAEALIARLRSG